MTIAENLHSIEARGLSDGSNAVSEQLWYRLHFILGPRPVESFSAARHLTLRKGLYLTAHSDLNVQIARFQEKTIALVGFLLDPENPHVGDAEIIETLVRGIESCSDLYRLTARLGGRWILIADDGQESILFTDPAGLRQVFYTDLSATGQLWCGSDPGLMAKILCLETDPEAVNFLQSEAIARNPENWWPGDSSLFREIRHLLPNHSLDLRRGARRRFWPEGKLPAVSFSGAVRQCSQLLAGSLEAAAQRFDLALPVTAGWDSRLLLAASRTIKDRLCCFTLKIKAANLTDDHPDIAVPRALLARLGLPHTVIEVPERIDRDFAAAFAGSVARSHDIWRLDAQAIRNAFLLQRVVIAGGVSEAARNFYRLPSYLERKLTGEKLAAITGMGQHPFAVRHFAAWLDELGPTYDFRILDLFYWEQRAGSWLAMCQKEFDVAWAEIFTPYNCRQLLATMLAVKAAYRQSPHFTLYREMMMQLWPEVLALPINPHKVPTRLVRVKRSLRDQLVNVKYFLRDHLS